MVVRAQAESWLAGQLVSVPEAKRAQVAALIRNSVYQMSVADALSVVTDPESATNKQRLAELEAENARLKERGTQTHGVSPAAAQASSASEAATKETMPWSDMSRTLKNGGAAAAALREKMDKGLVKADYAR